MIGLSFKRDSVRFNIGPRIFTVNLMLFNIVHSTCGLLIHGSLAYPQMRAAIGRKKLSLCFKLLHPNLGVYWALNPYIFAIQSGLFLVFNASFVPMMIVSILAASYPLKISSKEYSYYFAGTILVAGTI